MTPFDERKNAFEQKYAHDEAMNFRAEARACKLAGLWLAEQLGLSGADADEYAKSVVGANMDEPGFDDVKRFIMKDIAEKGLNITEHMLDIKLEAFLAQAKAMLVEEIA